MELQFKIASNIVRNQPKPIPINMEEATQMAGALLLEFEIKEKTDG